MPIDFENGITSRRQFLKTAGITGLGMVAVNLTGCGSSPGSAGASAAAFVPGTPQNAAGAYSYDAAAFQLAINLGQFGTEDCMFAAETRNFKVRALLHDAMYWKVERNGEVLLQQWTRISASDRNSDPSIVGSWVNSYQQLLTFGEDGSAVLTYIDNTCAAYGYLAEDAMVNNIFRQSIAAGDPATDGFIIWTRAQDDNGDVALSYEVATDHLFLNIVASGTAEAEAEIDHTVKVTLTGLNSDTTYFYRFFTDAVKDDAGNRQFSHTGRAKTLPVGSPTNLKFALLSCSSFPHGYFNAYRQVARRDDLDGCFHLGDYVYEYPGNPTGFETDNDHDYKDQAVVDAGRQYRYGNIRETVELTDYRLRFRNYREDIDLQLLHTRYSFINTWDDHETTNDSYDPDGSGPEGGAENHNDIEGLDEGLWEPRKAAAAQAYNEWLPITDVRTKGEGTYNDPRLDRRFIYGDLADMVVLDTRVGGRQDVANVQTDDYDDPNHVIMSDSQRNFMLSALTNSTATWKLFGQQIMMGHLIGPPLISNDVGVNDARWNCVINNDQWDGYDAERETIFQAIEDNGIENFVVLTGDIHTSWAINLVDDPRKRNPVLDNACVGFLNGDPSDTVLATTKRFGVEFVTPSITSPGLDDPGGSLTTGLRTNNPHIQDVDLVNRGYSIMEVTPEKTTCTWWHVNSITDQEDEQESLWRVFSVAAGAQELVNETPG